ncbi:MAG: hypothetical protein ACK4WH_11875, partial [Phycisphaerales bacterium]
MRVEHDDDDCVRVRGVGGRGVRMVVRSGLAPAGVDAEVDRVWEEMRRANPRLHDGPVALVEAAGPGEGEWACRAGRYREVATARALGRRVRALGVSGLVIGRDGRGVEHALFGRRGSQTRIYGGLWEHAPSGTVGILGDGAERIGVDQLAGVLREEGLEEVGIDLGKAAEVRAVATVEDARACSVDVVMRVEVGGVIEPRWAPCAAGASGAWEYTDTAWVGVREV